MAVAGARAAKGPITCFADASSGARRSWWRARACTSVGHVLPRLLAHWPLANRRRRPSPPLKGLTWRRCEPGAASVGSVAMKLRDSLWRAAPPAKRGSGSSRAMYTSAATASTCAERSSPSNWGDDLLSRNAVVSKSTIPRRSWDGADRPLLAYPPIARRSATGS